MNIETLNFLIDMFCIFTAHVLCTMNRRYIAPTLDDKGTRRLSHADLEMLYMSPLLICAFIIPLQFFLKFLATHL